MRVLEVRSQGLKTEIKIAYSDNTESWCDRDALSAPEEYLVDKYFDLIDAARPEKRKRESGEPSRHRNFSPRLIKRSPSVKEVAPPPRKVAEVVDLVSSDDDDSSLTPRAKRAKQRSLAGEMLEEEEVLDEDEVLEEGASVPCGRHGTVEGTGRNKVTGPKLSAREFLKASKKPQANSATRTDRRETARKWPSQTAARRGR